MENTSSDSDHESSGRSRKRKRDPQTWERNVTKTKRNLGQSYTSYWTKKDVPKREIGEPCKCGCFEKLGYEKINDIFNSFWSIGNYDKQNAYLGGLVKEKEIKRPTVKGHVSRKTRTLSYNIEYCHADYAVCRAAFLSIHGVSEKRVRNVLRKRTATGCVPDDKRGTNPSTKKISDSRVNMVVQHINSMPAVSSHYTRAKSPHRKYLDQSLNVNKLWVLYCQWLTENYNDEEPVSKSFYRSVFCSKFNLGFAPPLADTCNFCDRAEHKIKALDPVSDADTLKSLCTEKELHVRRAKYAQNKLRECKALADPSVAAIAFDLQQALPTPKNFSGVQYYKRKLWCYNLGIHNIQTGKACMYLWNETEGKRGSCEIASCLMDYIDTKLPDTVTRLMLFSDNCGGQNKNINLALTLLRYIHAGRFTNIEHTFMEPGHSYLPCDRDFGIIEKHLRVLEVYTPDLYEQNIKACKTKKPFEVVRMIREKFLDVTVLTKKITKRTEPGVRFSDAKVLLYSSQYKESYGIKIAYAEESPVFVKLQKGRTTSYNQAIFDLAAVPLQPKFSHPIRITPEKLADIAVLKEYIPATYKPFYEELILGQERTVVAKEVFDPSDDMLD